MVKLRRELPGDLLDLLRHENKIGTIRDFYLEHQKRIDKVLEEQYKTASDNEIDALCRRYRPEYQQWANRFAITWSDFGDGGRKPRALFRETHLEALLLAGWFQRENPLHGRFQDAIALETAMFLKGLTTAEIEEELGFQEDVELEAVFDTLSHTFFGTLTNCVDTAQLSFASLSGLAQLLSHDALPALAQLGLIEMPDEGDLSWLLDPDGTRYLPTKMQPETERLLTRLGEWAELLIREELEEEGLVSRTDV